MKPLDKFNGLVIPYTYKKEIKEDHLLWLLHMRDSSTGEWNDFYFRTDLEESDFFVIRGSIFSKVYRIETIKIYRIKEFDKGVSENIYGDINFFYTKYRNSSFDKNDLIEAIKRDLQYDIEYAQLNIDRLKRIQLTLNEESDIIPVWNR